MDRRTVFSSVARLLLAMLAEQRYEAAKEALARAKTLNVFGVLSVAMVLSSTASISGGIVMYYESLESLKDTVEETSACEVGGLVNTIKSITFDDADRANGQVINIAFISGYVMDDPATWPAIMTVMLANQAADLGFYGGAVVLIPHPGDEQSFAYFGSWGDPLRDGSKEHVRAVFNTDMNDSMGYRGGYWTVPIPTYKMNIVTGQQEEFLYNFNGGFYLDLDLNTVPQPTQAQQNASLRRIERIRMRPKGTFSSSDSTLYAYSGWDAYYAPPPPPHPWSKYRYVLCASWFSFTRMLQVVQDYATEKLRSGDVDTTVVLLDRMSNLVHATTAGSGYDQECWDRHEAGGSLGKLPTCSLSILNMSISIQEAVRRMNISGDEPQFRVMDLDGTSYFVRWAPANELGSNTAAVWMRPIAVVQQKVQKALVLLILFSLSVLLFDVLIFYFETVTVGLPLRQISGAVAAVGSMDTQAAFEQLETMCHRGFHVTEVHRVVQGMATTIENLNKFKMFLPVSTIAARDDVIDTTSPAGDVAIVFSDIVGSSRLWEDVPELMGVALDMHFFVLRTALLRHRGYEVKTIGDALMASFQDPTDAYNYAAECQIELTRQPWDDDFIIYENTARLVAPDGRVYFNGIQIRIGIHYGTVVTEVNPLTGRTDYRSSVVNKAARIEAHSLPGMIAFSEEFKALVTLPPGVEPRLLGLRELRGIGSARIYYATPRVLGHRDEHFMAQCAKAEAQVVEMRSPPPAHDESPVIALTSASLRSESGSMTSSVVGRQLSPSLRSDSFATQPSHRWMHLQGNLERTMLKADAAVVVANVELPDDHDVASVNCNLELILRSANTVVQRASDLCTMTSGALESVSGSQLVMSWGLLNMNPHPALQSLRFTGSFVRGLRDTRVTVGASIGPLMHGNVGTANRRFHSVLGVGFAYAQELAQLCPKYRTSALVVCTGMLPPHLRGCCVPVDVYRGTPPFSPHVLVEMPVVDACVRLKPRWGMSNEVQPEAWRLEDMLGDSGPVDQLRKALLVAAGAATAIGDDIPVGELPEEARRVYRTAVAGGAEFFSKYLIPRRDARSPVTRRRSLERWVCADVLSI